jgi:hypothetical protein
VTRSGAAILLVLAAAGSERAATAQPMRVVAGRDLATVAPPPGTAVESYSNSGYRLVVNSDGSATIEVELEPLRSRAGFVPGIDPVASPGIGRLAGALTAGSRDRFEAVSRVLEWVHSNIGYQLDRGLDQSPEGVLERRTAYCTGYARLAVALLAAVRIEAREVPGYVFEEVPGGPPAGFHRWIEVLYPDRGWVFSDPLASHHFVPATYLRLADDRLVGEPAPGRLLDRIDDILDFDVRSWSFGAGAGGVRLRANDDQRRAAALALRLEAGTDGEAFLEGGGVTRRLALPGGRGVFVGLEPGSYELRVEAGGRLAALKRVTFRDRVLASLELATGAGGEEIGIRR